MYSIGASNTNGYGFVNTAGTRAALVDLSPVNTGMLCPQLARIASCFSRFRYKKLGWLYEPMASTASGVRLAFAYSSDPYGSLDSVTSSTGYNICFTTPQSVAFSPWMPWNMTCQVPGDLCYTYAGLNTVAANIRQASVGTIACVADSNPGADFTYGILWCCFVLDLVDPIPTASSPALTHSTARLNRRVRIVDVEEGESGDDSVIVVKESPPGSCSLPRVQAHASSADSQSVARR